METMTSTSELVSAKALAKMLAVGERTIWRLRDGGKLPEPLRLGGAVRWRRSDILAWLEGGCRPVRAAGTPVGARG